MFAEIRDEGKEKIKEERKTKIVDMEIGMESKRERMLVKLCGSATELLLIYARNKVCIYGTNYNIITKDERVSPPLLPFLYLLLCFSLI